MTVDLATLGALIGVAVPIGGVAGWVIRQLVMDRLSRSEASIKSFGVRLQALKEWQERHDAVEGERARVRRETRGIPGSDG